jgi:hypothetical protein
MVAADGIEGDEKEIFRWFGGAGLSGENQQQKESDEGSIPSPAQRGRVRVGAMRAAR